MFDDKVSSNSVLVFSSTVPIYSYIWKRFYIYIMLCKYIEIPGKEAIVDAERKK